MRNTNLGFSLSPRPVDHPPRVNLGAHVVCPACHRIRHQAALSFPSPAHARVWWRLCSQWAASTAAVLGTIHVRPVRN